MDKNFKRRMETLSLVQANVALSTTEIHRRLQVRGLNVTARTVQRDLFTLSAAYGIECIDKAKPFSWRWPKNRPRLSVPGMAWPEALSFMMIKNYLGALLPASVSDHLTPYFEQARTKLGEHFDDAPMRRWPDKVRVIAPNQPLIAPEVKRAVHDVVSEALLAEKQIEIDYRSVGSDKTKRHRIHPLGLVLEGRVLYLVARFFDYDEARILALHRIEKAKALSESAVPPEGFTLDNYVAQGAFGCGGEESIKLDATWRYSSGDHLLQSKLSRDQEVDVIGNGEVRIRATVVHTERLEWWLMGFGDRVVVHGPRKLRKHIREGHEEAAQRYLVKNSARRPKSADSLPPP